MVEQSINQIKCKEFWLAVLAEFEGTMFFLICVVCVALGWGAKDVSANNVEIGLGIGLAIASLAQAFGHVSGGHLNPAVSLGMVVAGRISAIKGVFYIIAQIAGGALGTSIVYACTPKDVRGSFAVNSLGAQVTPWQGLVLEAIFTFLLVFMVISITDPSKNVEAYGTTLGIGVVILVAHLCIIPFTGCGINPARSFGPSLVMNKFDDHWVFWVGPILGALLAAIQYRFMFSSFDESSSDPSEHIPLRDDSVKVYT